MNFLLKHIAFHNKNVIIKPTGSVNIMIKRLIFKNKEKIINRPLTISKVEQKLDVPKVIFEDLELQVTIGQWLEILTSQESFINSKLTIYMHLSAEKLMKKMNIPA